MRNILLPIVALAALTGVVQAAETPSGNPPPALNWTGPYGGVEGGFDFGDAGAHLHGVIAPPPAPPQPPPEDFGSNQTSGLIGGVIGYNFQVERFVLGLEGDLGGVLGGGHTVATTGGGFATTSSNYYADIRGRLGYATGRALFYVAGGVAFGDQDTVYTPPPTVAASFTSDRTGWTIGGGVDYAFADNWIGRVEYRYTDLGDADYYFTPTAYDRVSAESSAVLLGLMYKFGGPRPVVAKY